MIIVELLLKEPLEAAFAQHDHMIQALAADAPDQPFHVGILPWALRGDDHFCDPHVLHPLPKRGAVDPVPIMEEIPRGLIPRKGVDDLRRCPRGGGRLGHVDGHEPSPVVGEDHEHGEHFV
jgi:hypothetical protein